MIPSFTSEQVWLFRSTRSTTRRLTLCPNLSISKELPKHRPEQSWKGSTASRMELRREVLSSNPPFRKWLKQPELPCGKTPMSRDPSKLENLLGYCFRDATLLEQALTHSSAANERTAPRNLSNEQLEFLGDSIIGFLVSDYLYQKLPHLSEGQLSKMRAHLVSSANFFSLAKRLGLGEFLHLGKGEEKTGGRKKQALLADGFEALVAAIYLDGGLDSARQFVLKSFRQDFQSIEAGAFYHTDFKSQLQERLQALRFPPAEYSLIGASGPDHKKHFSVELKIEGKKLSEGHGETKKGAEQEAARLALKEL